MASCAVEHALLVGCAAAIRFTRAGLIRSPEESEVPMENEKRALVAVGLSLLVLLAWPYLMSRWPGQQPAQTPATSQPSTTPTIAPASPNVAPASGATPTAAAATPASPPEQITTVERPGLYRAQISSHGATLISYELLDPKYRSRDHRRLVPNKAGGAPSLDRSQLEGPTNLLSGYRPSLQTRFTSGFAMPEGAAFVLAADETLPDQGRRLTYVHETTEYRLQKTLLFPPKAYQVLVQVVVQNRKSQRVDYHLSVSLDGFQDPSQKPGGVFSARVPQNEATWGRGKKMYHIDLEGLQNNKADADDLRGDIRWIGIGQQYFLVALALPYGGQIGDKLARVGAEANGAISVSAELAEHSLNAGESREYYFTAYAGPKLPELLDAVSVGGQTANLGSSIDYTFEVLARPMLWVLRQIYDLCHNWALAIVLLTLLVKLLLFYPSHRATVSSQGMAELKPQIDALQAKYPDDKAALNQEMMGLYRKHRINPLGGCLPILLQMPIYFALYSMLGNAVELYHVRLFWINDLTAADPYFVLPLVTGALIFLQSKYLSPLPPTPEQRTMVTMMPLMFTVFTIFVPAGLTVYILTNTVLGMAQQVITKRILPPKKVEVAAATVVDATPPGASAAGGPPRRKAKATEKSKG